MIRKIMEPARSMRLHGRFPLQFWEYVVDIFVYLINKEPSSSLDGGIPKEAWTCKKVNYSFLKTFGCESFFHIDTENRTKYEEKSKKCTFIRYGVNDFGYCLWDYENHKIIRSRKITECLIRSLKNKFQRYQKIKMYNNRRNWYLKLLQVLLEDLLG
jgi:hypothetical protein